MFRKLLDKVVGDGTPPGFTGTLDKEESVVVAAEVKGGGHLVVTSLGLWVPAEDGYRRIGWHLLSKVTWADGVLVVIEADESGEAGDAVLLTDKAPRRYPLAAPGKLPQAVHRRVTGSIRSRHHRELPGGGAWFVQRKVPGRDGIVLQVRADPGTDPDAVRTVAAEVAIKIREALQ
ncbi:hypothetical protein [Actinophytocola algeriensis]|uniref:Uncharacterized protein n=1 Tax=Actinophytocola algeriensis TaxID=1768010 RepID=A0A7W7VFE4_9PSEU|nr:hypothetical protein [Actinophytocola algeriensis]MBB4908221.1 hypothetical protein [Actinophytocola algeriensis]MBE1480251.1 hypothetical protein [Actinophytocola algeriensis]